MSQGLFGITTPKLAALNEILLADAGTVLVLPTVEDEEESEGQGEEEDEEESKDEQ